MPVRPLGEALTAGVKKALAKQPHTTVCACGFPMPKYPGRYPKKCPACGEPRTPTSDAAPKSEAPA